MINYLNTLGKNPFLVQQHPKGFQSFEYNNEAFKYHGENVKQ